MLEEIAAALADALADVATQVGENLVVQPFFIVNPAAPTIDIYPADPFEAGLGFGESRQLFWAVRARVHTPDNLGAQSVLLSLMEPVGDTSVEAALTVDQTLGDVVESLGVDGPTGYTTFIDQVGVTQQLGVSWRVTVLTKESA